MRSAAPEEPAACLSQLADVVADDRDAVVEIGERDGGVFGHGGVNSGRGNVMVMMVVSLADGFA
jgi:hypothetical protein